MAFIEVVCSDPVLHRRRLAGRSREIEGFPEPAWEAVERRREELAAWADARLVLDSVNDLSLSVETPLRFLSATA
ncbi:hypothetical protein ACGFX2_26890 [Streptomyces goshikiensis]|uniref:hypothetical protein n=1 Tax=Streptomyces goshikiensis TaxID=1942 RepID=UPI003713ABC8